MCAMRVGYGLLSLTSEGRENAAAARFDLLGTDGKLHGLGAEAANRVGFEIGCRGSVSLVLKTPATARV